MLQQAKCKSTVKDTNKNFSEVSSKWGIAQALGTLIPITFLDITEDSEDQERKKLNMIHFDDFYLSIKSHLNRKCKESTVRD